MTSDYVRICDLPDLQPGDLLWCGKTNGQGVALFVMEGSPLRGWFLSSSSIEMMGRGWAIEEDVISARVPVKVLRRLRGVTREEIGRWNETHARLLASKDLSAKAPLKVDDIVPADRVDEVPDGACVQSSGSSNGIWRQVGNKWVNVCFSSVFPPYELLPGPGTRTAAVAVGCRLVALDCKATDRTGLARELAAQGWEPARKWLQHHNLADAEPSAVAKFKVGDVACLDELPVGSVITSDTGDWWAVRTAHGGRYMGYCLEKGPGRDDDPFDDVFAPGSMRGKVIGFDAPLTTGALRRWAMDRAYLMAQSMQKLYDTKVQTALSAQAPKVLKVGDKVTSQAELDALPPGSIVKKYSAVWQRVGPGPKWRPVSLAEGWHTPLIDADVRLSFDSDGEMPIIALDVLANDRVSFARALAAQGHEPAAKALRDRPPMPKPGDRLTVADLAALPVGAVVDDGDPEIPWNVKTPKGWLVMGLALEGEGPIDGTQWYEFDGTTFVALDAPTRSTGELRQWAAARGYVAALEYEAEAKKALDGSPVKVQTQDMATPPASYTLVMERQPGESQSNFELRVAGARVAGASPGTLIAETPKPAPSLLQRLGASMKAAGADVGRAAWNRAQVKAVHVGIDGAKGALHLVATEIAEAIGGVETANKVARIVQMPTVQAAEDLLLSVGADLAGRPALAAVARERFAERTVDGAAGLVVNHVVRVGSRAVAALRGADEAATTAIAEGSPVSAGQVEEAQS